MFCVCDAGVTLYRRLAKAACNNDDSLGCNKLNFIIELNYLFEAGGRRCL